MDVETAKAMLQLLLSKNWTLYPQFAQFLEQSKYKVINKDQWCNILEFSRTINTSLTNYDIDGACESLNLNIFNTTNLPVCGVFLFFVFFLGPVMLDEFVEWLRQQNVPADPSS